LKSDVIAVVVTYNRKELLLQCIRCLQGQTKEGLEILIVDNASTDGTEQALLPFMESKAITYVNTGANLGGAGGFQFGLNHACKSGHEYIWMMDDDSAPEPDALEKLIAAAEELGHFGYLSGKTLWTDGSLCKMNIQRDTRLAPIKDFRESIIPSGAATFVSLLIPRTVIRQIGLPIGEFFIWADDLEYTRRISRMYPCYVVVDSITVHHCETNNGGNIATDAPSRIDRYRYAYRNEVYLYRREGVQGIMHLLLRTPLHIFRVLIKSKDCRLRRIRTILAGTLDGLSFKPSIEYPDPEQH